MIRCHMLLLSNRINSGTVPRLKLEQWLHKEVRPVLTMVDGATVLDLLATHTFGALVGWDQAKQAADFSSSLIRIECALRVTWCLRDFADLSFLTMTMMLPCRQNQQAHSLQAIHRWLGEGHWQFLTAGKCANAAIVHNLEHFLNSS